MPERTSEDQLIRSLAILVSTAAFAGVLFVATVITVLVSANFNVLQWME